MKKSLIFLFLISFFILKGFNASAQLTYEQGYVAGYQFAIDKLKLASDAHPEWALVLQENETPLMGSILITYSVIQDDYQRHQLAVNSVNVDYLAYILSMKDVDVSWNGYYFGFQQATADFEIGM